MCNNYRTFLFGCALLCLLLALSLPAAATESHLTQTEPEPLTNDALIPPDPPDAPQGSTQQSAGPSQFMAGDVAIRLILPESDGSIDASQEDWTPAQIAAITEQVQAALNWWDKQIPQAHLNFHLDVQVVPTAFEPINYTLQDEGLWIGDLLGRMGYSGSYFEKAYAATYDWREQQGSDWATLIFVANSANDANGRFADNRFAYAYINGPFMVLTSDVGAYGTQRLAPVSAHELGHIFGALDQYKSAEVACDQRSGYLNMPTTNSQIGGCPTNLPSIMLSPVSAYLEGAIDPSARAQVGDYDSDGDGIIDPLDTTPVLQLDPVATTLPGERPVITGQSSDTGYPSRYLRTVSINPIERVEYRADGGSWQMALPEDEAFDSTSERFTFDAALYDGSHLLEVRTVNRMGISSTPVSLTVAISGIGSQPAYQVHAPELSNSVAITLDLDAPADTTGMQISSDPLFREVAWQPFQRQPGFQLVAGDDGARRVYVRFRDAKGYVSLAYEQQVILDTTAPTGQVAVKRGTTLQAVLQAEDPVSGIETVEIRLNDGGETWHLQTSVSDEPAVNTSTADHVYYAEVALPSGTTSIQVCFHDAAGNVSPYFEASTNAVIYLPLVVRP